MLIIRKGETNNLVVTVSMNKTLPNPYYLFSFQHIASKERVSFIPQPIVSNTRYDKFRFVEGPVNLSSTPPVVPFNYIGQYYYSIYEQTSPTNTDINLAYNKLESGRAIVIVGNSQTDECLFEPYISPNEDAYSIIYVSEQEDVCITGGTPCPEITQYLEVELSDSAKFKLSIWNDSGYTSVAQALCDYTISGTAYGDMGTVYSGVETIPSGQHVHSFNLTPILEQGEIVSSFEVHSYSASTCECPVTLILP